MLFFQPFGAAALSYAAFVPAKICLISAFSSGVSPSASANAVPVSTVASGRNTPWFRTTGGGETAICGFDRCEDLVADAVPPPPASRSAFSTAARPQRLIMALRAIVFCICIWAVLYMFCVAIARPNDPYTVPYPVLYPPPYVFAICACREMMLRKKSAIENAEVANVLLVVLFISSLLMGSEKPTLFV